MTAAEPVRGPAPSGRRPTAVLLAVVVLLVAGAGALVSGAQAADRWRADVPVRATYVGEPGCVSTARTTTPDGVTRDVDVTGYRAGCLDRDPGGTTTLWYAAGDPSVVVSSRAWWWPLLGALGAAALAGVAARGLLRHRRPDPAGADGRRPTGSG